MPSATPRRSQLSPLFSSPCGANLEELSTPLLHSTVESSRPHGDFVGVISHRDYEAWTYRTEKNAPGSMHVVSALFAAFFSARGHNLTYLWEKAEFINCLLLLVTTTGFAFEQETRPVGTVPKAHLFLVRGVNRPHLKKLQNENIVILRAITKRL